MSQGVYVLGGKCPGGKCPGGKCPGGICPWGKCPGGKCPGGVVLEQHHSVWQGLKVREGRRAAAVTYSGVC